MDKQKVRPLDEERESRSLLSNAVVILHLVFGTLPLLLVVWAVDRLMSDNPSRQSNTITIAQSKAGKNVAERLSGSPCAR